MAAGDITFFDQYYVDLQLGIHALESHTIKAAFIDDTTAPTAADADPRWGSGGSTDLSTNEVTAGGNYSAGGATIANITVSLASAKGRFDADDVDIAQDGSNPTDARWQILYNDTASGKQAIAFVDLGSNSDLSAGPFDEDWNASGISELGAAA